MQCCWNILSHCMTDDSILVRKNLCFFLHVTLPGCCDMIGFFLLFRGGGEGGGGGGGGGVVVVRVGLSETIVVRRL